jgi:outer membrane protein assembly factor BamB
LQGISSPTAVFFRRYRRSFSAILSVAFLLSMTLPLRADEAVSQWPHLRGPHYDGVSEEVNLINGWDDRGPAVLWMVDVGTGYSGIIAVGDKLFTQSQDLYGQYVACLDKDTGREIWRRKYDWAYDGSGLYPGPRATPTYANGRVFFASTTGAIGCLDAETGREIWTRNVTVQFDGKGTGFGYSCCPLIVAGKVILPVGGQFASMVALDANDGSVVWKQGSEPASYCGAIPIELQGDRYVIGFLRNTLVCHDLESGNILWKRDYSSGYDEHSAYPMYREPFLAVASPFMGGAEMYELAVVKEADGGSAKVATEEPAEKITAKIVAKPKWISGKLSNDVATSVLLHDHIYGFDLKDIQSKLHRPSRGQLRCIEFETGNVVWSTDRTGQVSLVAADGKLFMLSDEGVLIVAAATPDEYRELARVDVFPGERCWTSPSLHDGRLYLRSPTRAACILLRDEARLSNSEKAKAKPAIEVVEARYADSLSLSLGGEREFPYDPPEQEELIWWYQFSVASVFLPAFVLSVCIELGLRVKYDRAVRRRMSRVVFWVLASILAVVATPIGNRLANEFVFTWPAALYIAFQTTLTTVIWSGKKAVKRRDRRLTWIVAAAFASMCFTYFHLCKRLGLALEWVFLLGFIFSLPVALIAGYQLVRQGGVHRDFCWSLLSFSVFFWTCGYYIMTYMAP